MVEPHTKPQDSAEEIARKKAQRRRSIAIALALAGFALIFYVLTIAKMGPTLFERPL